MGSQVVNFSNHPSAAWSKKQTDAFLSKYQAEEIVDVPFPAVSPETGEEEVRKLADSLLEKILMAEPRAVMVQGEFGLSFSVVERLKERNIPAVYACSERKVKETINAEGKYTKEVSFEFVRFREY